MTQERFPSPFDFSLENFLGDEVVLSAREYTEHGDQNRY